ncbi:uncharacterized protein LOC117127747 [Brassica rapa]|uniref:uncharacterized protein LOC117127747 n=1 Tax=Brassica campestris TaxID=3711 RepID=UPI00142D556B|nr:uncharacterized protein LOC117127747 [Brassica rapa]
MTPLASFEGKSIHPLGIISLTTRTHDLELKTEFTVVSHPIPFDAIIGRPWMHQMRAVPSVYHQYVKFLSSTSEKTILGSQKRARACYMSEFQKMSQREENIQLARELSVEYSAKDLSSVVGLEESSPKKKRRKLGPERAKAVNDEVDKLRKIGSIREVQYPDWLANPVVVTKKNGKWRVCIDFTDLNKACSKDSFPLPHIDRLVEATAGHDLLLFMDAFSGYNQILMNHDDQEKTTFITERVPIATK